MRCPSMNENDSCPEIETLIEYFEGIMTDEKKRQMEEHFFTCSRCIETARQLSEAYTRQRVVKASAIVGKAWEKYGDAVEAKAAGESHSQKIREFTTTNGKFRVTLRPLEKNPDRALLEVEVFDRSFRGRIRVSGVNYFNEVAEVDDNYLACMVVNSSIDIDKISIRKHE